MNPSPSVDPRSQLAYCDGQWTELDQVSIDLTDLGFRQAVTVVERLRTYGRQVFAPERHVERFLKACTGLGLLSTIDGTLDNRLLMHIVDRLINQLPVNQRETGIVLLATPGTTANGVCRLIAYTSPIDLQQVQRRRTLGQPLVVTDVYQVPNACWSPAWKVRSRLNYYLADQQAAAIDAEATGALLHFDGFIADTSIASIAIIRGDRWVRPPRGATLPSITMSVVEPIVAEIGLQVDEGGFDRRQLEGAEEVWLMGVTGGLWFARSVDGVAIYKSNPGYFYKKALCLFDQHTKTATGT